jgi:tRNA(Ile)-lysidine synthase
MNRNRKQKDADPVQLDKNLLYHLRDDQSLLCVACSAGSDSMALLHLLHGDLSLRHKISVLHFDHGIRGEESAADAKFVAEVACRLHIPIVLRKCEHFPYPKRTNEDWLRRQRFQFFHGEMRRMGAIHLLTAHHRDDVLETFLLRLWRGSSIDGLTALRPIENRRDGFCYVRPLLNFPKEKLQKFLMERRISWREDSSNMSMDYLRNRIRHRLLPLWKELDTQRNLCASLLRSRDMLQEDGEALTELTDKCFQEAYLPGKNALYMGALQGRPRAILRRIVHRYFLENGHLLERQLADHLCATCYKGEKFQISVAKELFIKSDGETMEFAKIK